VVDVRLDGRADVVVVREDGCRAASVDAGDEDDDELVDDAGEVAGDDVFPSSVGPADVDGSCGGVVVPDADPDPEPDRLPRWLSDASTRTCRPAESIAYQAAAATIPTQSSHSDANSDHRVSLMPPPPRGQGTHRPHGPACARAKRAASRTDRPKHCLPGGQGG
jgi:hypothetical protein